MREISHNATALQFFGMGCIIPKKPTNSVIDNWLKFFGDYVAVHQI